MSAATRSGEDARPHVVIVGGGFGGLYAARSLRGAPVGEIRGRAVHGLVAWLIWLFVHLMYLVGFRNRVAVLFEWAWSYLTWQRGARLITGRMEPGRQGPAIDGS